jgi:hypothetical protein
MERERPCGQPGRSCSDVVARSSNGDAGGRNDGGTAATHDDFSGGAAVGRAYGGARK